MTEAYGLWILHGSAFPWTASVEEHKRCKLNLHSVTEVNKIPLQQINVHINWTWNVTLIYHGQLSLREVITQKWIHAEICTLLANTLRRLRQVITPRRIHFEPMLLASLACSLRSRPQAASRPSASRMPGVSKLCLLLETKLQRNHPSKPEPPLVSIFRTLWIHTLDFKIYKTDSALPCLHPQCQGCLKLSLLHEIPRTFAETWNWSAYWWFPGVPSTPK